MKKASRVKHRRDSSKMFIQHMVPCATEHELIPRLAVQIIHPVSKVHRGPATDTERSE